MNPDLKADEHERQCDPISGAPGAHPVGVGVGTALAGTAGGAALGMVASTAAAGAALGSVAGPIGTVAGVVVGGIAGAFTGKAIAESVSPTVEDGRPLSDAGDGLGFGDDDPAYRFGSQAHSHLPSARFEDVEDSLRQGWELTHLHKPWNEARTAIRDGWDHVALRSTDPMEIDFGV